MDILDVEIATLTIDIDPINITVILDGAMALQKSLDGKTTLAIHKKVSNSIEIQLSDTAAQVHINMRELQKLEGVCNSLFYIEVTRARSAFS